MLFIDQLQYMHLLLHILLRAGVTKTQAAMLILLTKVDFFLLFVKAKEEKHCGQVHLPLLISQKDHIKQCRFQQDTLLLISDLLG